LNPVVHLELHTADEHAARDFYASLLRWRGDRVRAGCASYRTLDLGRKLGGGIVECPARRASWLPYVVVEDVEAMTALATRLGASVLLEPREGPAGWRSVVETAAGGEIALWQIKGRRR
jgi:predicted enzyme related to lactoylglutathione lyase